MSTGWPPPSRSADQQGVRAGGTGNNEAAMSRSQVQAAKAGDVGARAVSGLGGLPVVENTSVSPGSARVVLAGDYTDPVPASTAAIRHWRPSFAAADPWCRRALRRWPGIRAPAAGTAAPRSHRCCSIRSWPPMRPVRGSPTTTTRPASASSCRRSPWPTGQPRPAICCAMNWVQARRPGSLC
jgi:hypothetical protein